MATLSVNRMMLNKGRTKLIKKHQQGIYLVEMMVAAVIGIMALLAVGSVFLSGQKLATDRSQRLLVLQNMSDALRYIKEDAQRAGFNGANGNSLLLSGATGVITTAADSLSYAYLTAGGKINLVNFKGDVANHKLTVCVDPNITSVNTSINCTTGNYSLMDDERVELTAFSVAASPLGSSVSSAYITISMTADLKDGDGSKAQTMVAKIKQRNWN